MIIVAWMIVAGCSPRLDSYDEEERQRAVLELQDQRQIAQIAMHDESPLVRDAAMGMLVDVGVIVGMINGGKDQCVSGAAMHKLWELGDRDMVINYALNDRNVVLRDSAVGVLLFHENELKDMYSSCRSCDNIEDIAKILIMCSAVSNVSMSHRDRVGGNVLDVIRFLSRCDVSKIVGNVVSVNADWKMKKQKYEDGYRYGEVVEISVVVSKAQRLYSYSWETDFPNSVPSYHEVLPRGAGHKAMMDFLLTDHSEDSGFFKADINVGDILRNIIATLSQESIDDISRNDVNAGIRKVSVEIGRNNLILRDAAVSDEDANVRCAAVGRLTDQYQLIAIAKNDANSMVRCKAVAGITSQDDLCSIVLMDSDASVRLAAMNRITNQAFFEKLAINELSDDIRKKAIDMIIDQRLLVNVVLQCNDNGLIGIAIRKIDQPTLLMMIVDSKCSWDTHRMAQLRLNEISK